MTQHQDPPVERLMDVVLVSDEALRIHASVVIVSPLLSHSTQRRVGLLEVYIHRNSTTWCCNCLSSKLGKDWQWPSKVTPLKNGVYQSDELSMEQARTKNYLLRKWKMHLRSQGKVV